MSGCTQRCTSINRTDSACSNRPSQTREMACDKCRSAHCKFVRGNAARTENQVWQSGDRGASSPYAHSNSSPGEMTPDLEKASGLSLGHTQCTLMIGLSSPALAPGACLILKNQGKVFCGTGTVEFYDCGHCQIWPRNTGNRAVPNGQLPIVCNFTSRNTGIPPHMITFT